MEVDNMKEAPLLFQARGRADLESRRLHLPEQPAMLSDADDLLPPVFPALGRAVRRVGEKTI